ncbi:MAG: hypothetical protein N2644_00160 [Candidatus Sumerlaea chitinivorans]|uniref:Uncharacterized protein n=1 Tax=Sumerlaea chitinivorans TaxID=2250252 RepID=A0A2Z4Y658_SUMC1|nr:hypothetical protein BRCON_1679 [Candidatus Sumerlaea chitinivorans]MCX7962886.1 hypothetical protein [Candidatus Sumerlaea chitinivorans]
MQRALRKFIRRVVSSLGTLSLVASAMVLLVACRNSPESLSGNGAKVVSPRKAHLIQVAHVPLPTARAVALQGRFVWVAQNFAGATLLDLSDPTSPTIVRRFAPTDLQPLHFQVVDKPPTLVVADRFRGLVIWDVASPDQPTSLSELRLPGIATHVDVFTFNGRRLAAVACGGEGLTVCDITDPRAPRIVAHANRGTDYSRRVKTVGRLILLADNFDGGLKVFGLRDSLELVPYYQVRIPGFCEAVAVKEDLVFCAYRTYGTAIFRLKNVPTNESALDTPPTLELLCQLYRTKDYVRDVVPLENDFLAVLNSEGGVDLYDVRDPQAPLLVSDFLTPDVAMSAAVLHNWVCVAAWDAGLLVTRLEVQPKSAAVPE